jgi:glycosyltransferase involved in cell wall biosynthesis
MSEPPRISIVIPAYNAEKYIGLTIESIRAQTFGGWELVVLDDGSKDGTAAVCESYAACDSRIRVIPRENGGVAAARNRGFAETDPRSEFAIFLDNDDLWEPEALASLLGALDTRPECVSAHALARSIDGQGGPLPGDDLEERLRSRRALQKDALVPLLDDAPTTFAALVTYNCIVSPGLHLVRRPVLEAIGGFDPATVPCDDWDFSLRISRHGDIAYVPRVVLNWRRHEANASDAGSARWRRAYYTVWRKTLSSRENSPEQRRIARDFFLYLCRLEMRGARRGLAKRNFAKAAALGKRAFYNYAQYLRAMLSRSGSKE